MIVKTLNKVGLGGN